MLLEQRSISKIFKTEADSLNYCTVSLEVNFGISILITPSNHSFHTEPYKNFFQVSDNSESFVHSLMNVIFFIASTVFMHLEKNFSMSSFLSFLLTKINIQPPQGNSMRPIAIGDKPLLLPVQQLDSYLQLSKGTEFTFIWSETILEDQGNKICVYLYHIDIEAELTLEGCSFTVYKS